MPVKNFRPLTPSTRYITIADYGDITSKKPEKDLVMTRKKTGGRNCYGRITARGIGGGHKQKIRVVDFKRHKHGVEATVAADRANIETATVQLTYATIKSPMSGRTGLLQVHPGNLNRESLASAWSDAGFFICKESM